MEESEPAVKNKKRLKKTIIDCDIHNETPMNEVKEYLPRFYRDMVDSFGARNVSSIYLNGTPSGRLIEGESRPRSASPRTTKDIVNHYRSKLLDPFHLEYGILTASDYSTHTLPDIDFAAAIASAKNDYIAERWLAEDSRLKGSVFIPKQDPALSAKEINRVGSHPDVVQVIVSSGAEKPYGHRFYYPIYEACVKHNLPFTIHVSMEGLGMNPAPTGAGYVTYYAEYRAARPQVMAAHLASFIYEGVFERFPDLRVVLQESGVMWIAPALWKMDQDWKGLRHQTPWVKKPPSEYFRQNVRVTSQPLEIPPDRELFDKLLTSIHANECLLYCSDYPHWDFDSPAKAFPKLEDGLWERVFYQNAADLYGLPQRKG
ncbi:amidohydrolase family protein [Paenibacillus daejeonensis]|uniref:amidohydrolase family protein n=1 Tax=Paenibacillus daejeonensis TaxID=135193 RepID=UPI000381F2A1|nr:amidohydrolase family protein [Paenibacillus daejeonensis]